MASLWLQHLKEDKIINGVHVDSDSLSLAAQLHSALHIIISGL
jgi:hypothetical protein